jgi:hypothetical protein
MRLHRFSIFSPGKIVFVPEEVRVTMFERKILRRKVALDRLLQCLSEGPVLSRIAYEPVVRYFHAHFRGSKWRIDSDCTSY